MTLISYEEMNLYGLSNDISNAMKKFNDLNEQNYIIKFIDIHNLKLFDYDSSKNLIIYTKGKYTAYWCFNNLKFMNPFHVYYIDDDTDIYLYSNIYDANRFYKKYELSNDITYIMKKFNDYNKDNYLITYCNVEFDKKDEFNQEYYDIIHTQYLRFINKNSFIKKKKLKVFFWY